MKKSMSALGRLFVAALVREAKSPAAQKLETLLVRAVVAYVLVKLGIKADQAA